MFLGSRVSQAPGAAGTGLGMSWGAAQPGETQGREKPAKPQLRAAVHLVIPRGFCHKNAGFDCSRVKKLFLGVPEGFTRAGCGRLLALLREHLFCSPKSPLPGGSCPLSPSGPRRGLERSTARNLLGGGLSRPRPHFPSSLCPALVSLLHNEMGCN